MFTLFFFQAGIYFEVRKDEIYFGGVGRLLRAKISPAYFICPVNISLVKRATSCYDLIPSDITARVSLSGYPMIRFYRIGIWHGEMDVVSIEICKNVYRGDGLGENNNDCISGYLETFRRGNKSSLRVVSGLSSPL